MISESEDAKILVRSFAKYVNNSKLWVEIQAS